MGPSELSYISALALKARSLSYSIQEGKDILSKLDQSFQEFQAAQRQAQSTKTPVQYIAHTWHRNGWRAKKLDAFPTSIKSSYVSERFEATTCGEAALLQQVQDAIQTGSPLASIDALPTPLRDMLQSPYDWHLTSGKLFRIVHPETQAKDGQWGSDASEIDIDVLDDTKSTCQLLLEQCGIIEDCDEETAADLLGALYENDNSELIDTSIYTREDTDVNYLAENPQILSTLPIPTLDKQVEDAVRAIYAEYRNITEQATTNKELSFLRSTLYKRLNELVSPYLTYPLNSPFCAHKYSPPRRQHVFIQRDVISPVIDASEERWTFFWDLFKQVLSVTSEVGGANSLYGPYKQSGQGFYGLIRNMSSHDTLLKTEWSDYDKIDRKTGVITEAALKIQKREFIRNWREDQRGDEESLRVAIWALYDRVKTKVEPIYKDGKLIKPGRTYKDSIWRQQRARAWTNLFLTAPQWNAIYNMLAIQKKRITLDTARGYNNNADIIRKDTLKLLRKHFDTLVTISDVRRYRAWATKRDINWQSNPAGKINESLIDKISIRDEHRWIQATTTKERNLYMRLLLFNKAEEEIHHIQPTQLPEQAVVCPYLIKQPFNNTVRWTPCDCMAIGAPQYAELEDNKGLLFIPCDGCGHSVWLVDLDKPLTPRTLEELLNDYKRESSKS